MAAPEVKTDSAEIALVPLHDVDQLLQRAASCSGDETLAVRLPTRYKFRLRDIRTKRGTGPEGAESGPRGAESGPRGAESGPRAPSSACAPTECKFDVAECWMAYFPGCFAQTWGYRRALMVWRGCGGLVHVLPLCSHSLCSHSGHALQGEMQDQPLFILSRDNYPSLEYAEEIPTRSTVRRLEYADEQRNAGAARRIYRPMMSAVDTLRFMASDFARRGAPKTAGEGPAPAPAPASTSPAAPAPAAPAPESTPPAPASTPPAPASTSPAAPGFERERARLADLGARVADLPGSPTHAHKRRRLLRHETEFALRLALVDAYLALLQQLCAQGARSPPRP